MVNAIRSDNARFAALCRWAKTLCSGACKVKGKHIRGYKDCDKNPDNSVFGFAKKMGGE